jgi:hypothetical protein
LPIHQFRATLRGGSPVCQSLPGPNTDPTTRLGQPANARLIRARRLDH